ncbi:MAG: hypothetical protein ACRD3K_06640, partial [Edaphobacter sp.]
MPLQLLSPLPLPLPLPLQLQLQLSPPKNSVISTEASHSLTVRRTVEKSPHFVFAFAVAFVVAVAVVVSLPLPFFRTPKKIVALSGAVRALCERRSRRNRVCSSLSEGAQG